MPKLSAHHANEATKMLFIGDSGTGKTGALASLAEAGYKVNVLDFDNGLDIMFQLLKDKPEAAERVSFITCTDKFKQVNGSILPAGVPTAFSKGLKALDNWKDEDIDLGPVYEWGPDTVLVVDSMTLMSNAALRYVLSVNGRGTNPPQIQDWGQAMQKVEDLLALLYSDAIKCNVIVNSHISFIETENGIAKGYPSAIGSKLPPKVGRYFNTILLAKSIGSGQSAKRVIKTVPDGGIDVKHPAPGKIPAELPLATGLADFFKVLHGPLEK